MGLRIQLERQKQGLFPSLREYNSLWGIDEELLSLAGPDAVVMHPAPSTAELKSAREYWMEKRVLCWSR